MDAIVFYISGILSLVAAVLVVTRRNPVYSAIYLVLFFASISLDFLILRAPFLAVIQVLVYGGAIMVLFLFVIMLLNLTPAELRETVPRPRKVFAGVASLVLFAFLAGTISLSPVVRGAPGLTEPITAPALVTAGETAAIGESLFRRHPLPFEYSTILILIAIIGAIYLTKKRREPPRSAPQPARGSMAVEATADSRAPALEASGGRS